MYWFLDVVGEGREGGGKSLGWSGRFGFSDADICHARRGNRLRFQVS